MDMVKRANCYLILIYNPKAFMLLHSVPSSSSLSTFKTNGKYTK